MPWTPSDATRHTKKAKGKKDKRQWSDTANAVLKRGGSEASAVRIANAGILKKKMRRGR